MLRPYIVNVYRTRTPDYLMASLSKFLLKKEKCVANSTRYLQVVHPSLSKEDRAYKASIVIVVFLIGRADFMVDFQKFINVAPTVDTLEAMNPAYFGHDFQSLLSIPFLIEGLPLWVVSLPVHVLL